MADNQEHANPKEREIPVFTVLKNNCILKNIFLLDNPPSVSVSDNVDRESEMEEILIAGRHPDCNIKLEHPSISRFHLHIHSKPSSRSLHVTDLSSGKDSSFHFSHLILKTFPLCDQHMLFDRNDQVEAMGDDLEGLERLFLDENFGSSVQETSPMASEDLHNSVSIEEIEKCSSPGFCSQENGTSCDLIEISDNSMTNSKKKSGLNIWSRRGKPESVRIETSRLRGKSARIINTSSQVEKSFIDENENSESMIPMYLDNNEEENFMLDKENNDSPGSLLLKTLKSGKRERLNNDLDEEIFAPDKENMTPGSHLLRSMKNAAGKNPSSSHRSSPLSKAYNSNMYREETVARSLDAKSTNSASKLHGSSKKELALSEGTANRRVPFCPLPLESLSGHKSNSKTTVCEDNTMKDSKCIKYAEPEENKTTKVAKDKWIIVIDTKCLLDKKSREELNLLRGLKGTNLVIPRIELDCMLRRASFFTRTREIYEALQFIKESMTVAKWWIHVQSSAEEIGLLPPTPPASTSPHWFSEDRWVNSIGSSTPFSPCSLLQEIVTPTAGDHILDYALCCRKIRKDGQIVLLSDDLTLKIKAMAEGVLCETAREFRRSLVNPFSARFLFTNCSPFGHTWTCEDDTVLKEKYYPSPSKKVTKSSESGGVKGLKLILKHNSSFRQIRLVS
ncbi:forkhead-associated domain-containing family protein [Striga asiatica]|uniref:Forkhead-associated domain-containing family protein n=1 Tax=Striga asiatica TaxID=4170 RepID=A0A5A7PYQ6_STRAF|nr:forkhead-associated domain-containing family protein [Striga asiatica]